ncbi:GNAT family N-acetyltransferase [Candidatus Bipolaricaulota bacterium]|nr:GNAT family N-acetyltransferase [Candidatus Bipolaricaulota bacterium]
MTTVQFTGNRNIRPARPDDYVGICSLLQASHLPTQDLLLTRLEHFAVCVIDESLVGVIGLEVYGSQALVRSLAVAQQARSQGIAACLASYAQTRALSMGVCTLFALTTTAQTWLEKQGYAVLDRAQVPDVIRSSAQFRELCPASAVCLAKSIA